MSNVVEVPDLMTRSTQYFKKINEKNERCHSYVEYLKELVGSLHQVYHNLCKSMTTLSQKVERRLIEESRLRNEHHEVILEFVRNISFIHISISNQLSSNSVTLGTKTHRIAKNRLQILRERLFHCHKLSKEYRKEAEACNKDEMVFRQKCQYFKDYEKNVLKYYSLKDNVESHEKLKIHEIKLRHAYEHLVRKKVELQDNVHEIRGGIKDFFELNKNIASEYCRLLFNIRRSRNKNKTQLYTRPIIEEPSEQMKSSINRGDLPGTHRSDRLTQRVIGPEVQGIIYSEDEGVVSENIFFDFLSEFLDGVRKAADKIDSIQRTEEFAGFAKMKIEMVDILPFESIREVEMMTIEIGLFRKILQNIQMELRKVQVLREISKYRIFNYQKFIEETNMYMELQKKGQLSEVHRGEYQKLSVKFKERNWQLMDKFRERVVELEKAISSEYNREQALFGLRSRRKISLDIFDKPFFEVLLDQFFMSRQVVPFRENRYLKSLSMHLGANQVQVAVTLNAPRCNKRKSNWCCGLFEGGREEESPAAIDEYHCALKDGMMLVQGKLKIFERYLSFYSNFNSKTLFGYSDIRIPRWDIVRVSAGKHLLSLKITVETSHGSLDFTSFLNDPYEVLTKVYEGRKSLMSTFNREKSQDGGELGELQEQFQSHFQECLKGRGLLVDKLSTYLSEKGQSLSISLEYHPNGESSHYLFEIKVIQKMLSLDYLFIHGVGHQGQSIKEGLEEQAKLLINRQRMSERANNHERLGKLNHLSFSIIECNQKNKLSFFKEPSFLQMKDGSFDVKEEINKSHQIFPESLLFVTNKPLLETSVNQMFDSKIMPLSTTDRQDKEKAKNNENAHNMRRRASQIKIVARTEEKQCVFKDSESTDKVETIQSSQSLKSRQKKIRVQSRKSSQPRYGHILGMLAVVLVLNWMLGFLVA